MILSYTDAAARRERQVPPLRTDPGRPGPRWHADPENL